VESLHPGSSMVDGGDVIAAEVEEIVDLVLLKGNSVPGRLT
jgi:hypothetical protein